MLHVVVSEDNIVKLYLNPVWYLEEESSRQWSNTYKTTEMRICLVRPSRSKAGCVPRAA